MKTLYEHKYLKYKNKYKQIKFNLTGGFEKCYILYEKMLHFISKIDNDEPNFLLCLFNFINFCDNKYSETMEIIKQFDVSDLCYRAIKKSSDCFYSNTYNPQWFISLINNISNEKAVDICKLYIDSLINKTPLKTTYITDEIKVAHVNIDKIIKDKNINTITTDLINDVDIQRVIDTLSNVYMSTFNDMFDIKKRDKCCNCISIVLYVTGSMENKIKYLNKCLPCMFISLQNVDNFLDNFIIRFYLDNSIFETLYEFAKTAKNQSDIENLKGIFTKLKNIIIHEKSEIFIYFCNKIITKINPIQRVRTFRFISLFSEDTNVCIIREADGIVSIVDCHNIKLFTLNTTHKIMMTYNFNESSIRYKIDSIDNIDNYDFFNEEVNHNMINDSLINDRNNENYNHYSYWLNIYEEFVLKNPKYQNEQQFNYNTLSFIDIPAGVFGMKIKFSENYRNSIIAKVNNFYPSLINSVTCMTLKHDKDGTTVHDKNTILDILNNGYDEIILLELFSPIVRVNFYDHQDRNILNIRQTRINSKLFTCILAEQYDNGIAYKHWFEYILSLFNDTDKQNIIDIKNDIDRLSQKTNNIIEVSQISKIYLILDKSLKHYELKKKNTTNYAFENEIVNSYPYLHSELYNSQIPDNIYEYIYK